VPVERNGVVVSWIHHHARSDSVASALGLPALYMPWARPGQSAVRTIPGWFRSAAATRRALHDLPDGSLVIVQSPPVFAPLVALLVGRRHTVAVDLHSGAFNDPRWRWSYGLMQWVANRCDAAIVTNTALLADRPLRCRVIELHDPLEPVANVDPAPRTGPPIVVFPASGAADEPLAAVAEAARSLGDAAEVVVTGRVADRLAGSPVRATGFLPRDDYEDLLSQASVVLALTTRDATMQQAAYEALERGRPLVASGTATLRAALGAAAVYVEPDATSIADGVRRALAEAPDLVAAGRSVLEDLRRQSASAVTALLALRPRS